jgi:hypothetical protein
MELLGLYDPADAGWRVESALARAEFSYRRANRETALQWAAIAEVLDEAATSPDLYVDPALPMPGAERRERGRQPAIASGRVTLPEPGGSVACIVRWPDFVAACMS